MGDSGIDSLKHVLFAFNMIVLYPYRYIRKF